MAALAGGTGTTMIVENMFDSRYRHVDELSRMGARIKVEGRVAVVEGVERLSGAPVECTDLRLSLIHISILLAGKGHETYQIVGTEVHHLDEREVVAQVLGGA